MSQQQYTNSFYDTSQFNTSISSAHLVYPLKNYTNNMNITSQRNSAQVYPIVHNNPETPLTNTETLMSSNAMSPKFKSDDMPTLNPYPGPYDFNIFVPNGEYNDSKKKGQTCVFQTTDDGIHQLFTKPNPHYWRLNYSIDTKYIRELKNSVNNGFKVFVRLVPVFGDPEKAQCILERCPKHKEAVMSMMVENDNNVTNNGLKNGVTSSGNELIWRQRSMVLVEKSSACYMQDSFTKRVCVVLPWESPAEGQEYASVNCQFACYNSCFNLDSGGRKTLFLIVTLERLDESNGKTRPEVLGRQCLQFRSCACPSRDWRDKKAPGVQTKKPKEEKLDFNFSPTGYSGSIPINMGGKDAMIRVLPCLPGLDDAVDALVLGYLAKKTMSKKNPQLEPILEVFKQLKSIEHRIIEHLTTNFDPKLEYQLSRSRSVSPPDSQVSPNNTSHHTTQLQHSLSTLPHHNTPMHAHQATTIYNNTTASPMTSDYQQQAVTAAGFFSASAADSTTYNTNTSTTPTTYDPTQSIRATHNAPPNFNMSGYIPITTNFTMKPYEDFSDYDLKLPNDLNMTFD